MIDEMSGRTSLGSRLEVLLGSARPDVLEDYWWVETGEMHLLVQFVWFLNPFRSVEIHLWINLLRTLTCEVMTSPKCLRADLPPMLSFTRPCLSHLVAVGRVSDALKLMDSHDVMQGHAGVMHPSMMPQERKPEIDLQRTNV